MIMPKNPRDEFEEATKNIIVWIAVAQYGGIALFFIIVAALFYFGILGK